MYKLVGPSDIVLKTVAEPVANFGSHWRPILDSMLMTMHVHRGIGLAAPQIGLSRQVAVIQLGLDEPVYELFNPRLIYGLGVESMEEGCLSHPGYRAVKNRYRVVSISYQTFRGKKKYLTAEGLLAKAVLHEMDHLKGKTIYVRDNKRELKEGSS